MRKNKDMHPFIINKSTIINHLLLFNLAHILQFFLLHNEPELLMHLSNGRVYRGGSCGNMPRASNIPHIRPRVLARRALLHEHVARCLVDDPNVHGRVPIAVAVDLAAGLSDTGGNTSLNVHNVKHLLVRFRL